MNLSLNVSHWVCLLAGLLLVLTGFMMRDIVQEQTLLLTKPGAARGNRLRTAGYGRRGIMIAVGLAGVIYGIARIIP